MKGRGYSSLIVSLCIVASAHGQLLSEISDTTYAQASNYAGGFDLSGNYFAGLDDSVTNSATENSSASASAGPDVLTNWPVGVTSTTTFSSTASVANSTSILATSASHSSSQATSGTLNTTITAAQAAGYDELDASAEGYSVDDFFFTLTSAATITITGTMSYATAGDSVVSLYQNSNTILYYDRDNYQPSQPVAFTTTLGPGNYELYSYSQGTDILFPGTNNPTGSTSLSYNAVFNAVPEPSAVLILGGLVLLFKRKQG